MHTIIYDYILYFIIYYILYLIYNNIGYMIITLIKCFKEGHRKISYLENILILLKIINIFKNIRLINFFLL